jgi:hypothetical protein
MASEVTQLTNISSIIPQVFMEEIQDDFNRQTYLLPRIGVRDFTGKAIYWRVQLEGTSDDVGYAAEGASLTSFDQSNFTSATLSPINVVAPFSVTDDALMAAGDGVIPEELYGEVISDAARKLLRKIDQWCLYGTGSSQFAGLQPYTAVAGSADTARTVVPLANAAGAYAGITRDTTAGAESWYATHINSSDATLTEDLIDQLEEGIMTRCGYSPNLYMCSPAIARKFKGIFASTSNTERSTGSIDTVNLNMLSCQGVPLVRNPNIANNFGSSTANDTSYILGLNTRGLKLYQQSLQPNVKYMNPISGSSLRFIVGGLSKTGLSTSGYLQFRGNFAVLRPSEHGVLNFIK